MKVIDMLAATLLVVGGLNWGLWGALEFDLVAALLGGNTAILAKVVYCLVGVAAIYQIASIKAIRARWRVSSAMA